MALLTDPMTQSQAPVAEELFENAFHNAPIGMALVGIDGAFLKINGAFCRLVDYSEERMLALDFQTITHAEDLNTDIELLQRLIAGEIPNYEMEKRYIRADGSIVWVHLSVSMVAGRDGKPQYFISQVQDLSARRAAEETLAQNSRDLREAGKAALTAMRAAKAAAAAKSEFLANMSHEIRTPLTAIVGFADLLAARPSLDPVGASHVDRIAAASRNLLAIVNDILDFSRLEVGQVEISPRAVSPIEIAAATLAMFEAQAQAKGLTLELLTGASTPDFVSVDPNRLRQILVNLVANAVKFTQSGGVTVTLRHESDRLYVTVRDTGPGLTPDQQKKLFQRFSQVDGSSTRLHGGAGLGLAICKGLVEAMGGEISLKSRRGRGSIFELHVSAPTASEPGEERGEAEAPLNIDGVRVLVVDDNAANRELVRAVLCAAGVSVEEASGGEQAVRAALTTPYDIVLMDIRMPNMDGCAALQFIRNAAGPNQGIPILAFSADTSLAPPARGDFAFDDLISKPLEASALLRLIARWANFGLARPDQAMRA
jgi:PAS domain S-box-containing protein